MTDSGTLAARLAALGLALPPVAKPVAAYVPAVRSGNWIFCSGQLPFEDGELRVKGKVGGPVAVEEGKRLAGVAALGAVAAAADAAGGPERLARVVKVTGFVSGVPGFVQQSLVVNGASELLEKLFGERGRHARTSIGVAELPLDAPVEIEVVFEVRP